ncbi:Aldehyde/histidinol dehydrogenase [Pseudocohnilembus persalinus]|uniref:Aldehyde/histidinol dehydrogenase n=1 Tax=Pseudocohnilembus persalinus TaxID=266149 RepID=A0A0V0R2B5_PSEPJ|nr:Aldehyde/histidinol dehydrogenase [Pseudocohnilembus persalinus]|eukprot:KRX08655.1 Aldehyde/histidinol dehydrogenase [Pseudocohnilembus persalinus]
MKKKLKCHDLSIFVKSYDQGNNLFICFSVQIRGCKFSTKVPSWATIDPESLSESKPYKMENLIGGKWVSSSKTQQIVDPYNGGNFYQVPLIDNQQAQQVIELAKKVPKSGLHNPLRNPERYQMWGDINFKIAEGMRKPEIQHFFTRLTQRCMPKSYLQAQGEVVVTRKFFENFTGDNCRFLARGFIQPGDHTGQESIGYRWPYGPVALITPFNFPIEIPCLQLFGATLAGNRPMFKPDNKMALVMEQFFRFAIDCGMSPEELDFITSDNQTINNIVASDVFRVIQFTGSSKVAEHLSQITRGKVKIEDAGFDWKLYGPDVVDLDYAAWQADQDAYACSGQKCSAQSISFVHKNWVEAGLLQKVKDLAEQRTVDKLTIGPVITWTNEQLQEHCNKVLKIPGSKVLFGGKPLTQKHNIPSVYGSFEPTAIYVPLKEISNHYDLVTTEIFAPFQIITEYESEAELEQILDHLERMKHHLTCAVVSNDVRFQNKVLGSTVNGTTYAGSRARTTGAPQNHWFGPAGEPRGAGIGTPEAIKLVWTCHREIVKDIGPIPNGWTRPEQS